MYTNEDTHSHTHCPMDEHKMLTNELPHAQAQIGCTQFKLLPVQIINCTENSLTDIHFVYLELDMS